MPWVDKYRPSIIDEIVYQDDVIKMLKNVLKTGNLPHMLFYGPPGVGKTTTILAILSELYGPKKYSERVIELNASDERGINIVRNKIVTIAKMSVSEKDPKYICPPFKTIILDEADAMTKEAQAALRKVMEEALSSLDPTYERIRRKNLLWGFLNLKDNLKDKKKHEAYND